MQGEKFPEVAAGTPGLGKTARACLLYVILFHTSFFLWRIILLRRKEDLAPPLQTDVAGRSGRGAKCPSSPTGPSPGWVCECCPPCSVVNASNGWHNTPGVRSTAPPAGFSLLLFSLHSQKRPPFNSLTFRLFPFSKTMS